MKIKNLLFFCVLVFTLSSCSVRLVDFTAISSKNLNLNIDRSKGKFVKAEKYYFLGIGWNIKDALDKALNEAGPDYDLIIDGVVRLESYPFINGISVEGTAINSKFIKGKLGDVGFKKWISTKNITYSKKK